MSVEKSQQLEQLRRAVALKRLQQRQAAAGEAPRSAAGIPRADRDAPLPLSWAQQRLWFLDQLDHAAGAAYHMPASLRLKGRLDHAALRKTLDRIVARHENLRCTFVKGETAPVQFIAAEDIGFSLDEIDLTALDAQAREAQVALHGAEESATLFDLAHGPLIRGRLLRLSEEEHVLLVTQHHVISDGWSIGVMVREVTMLYAAFVEGREDPLPPLPIQYADYAAWQRDWLQGDALKTQVDYWRQRLQGAPELLELPTERPRPPVQSYRGDRVGVVFTATLTRAVRALSERHGTTLFMTLLAGWAAFLSRISRQSEVVVGTSAANRQRLELESLIGLFLNALPLRVSLDGNPTVAELLAQVKATTLDAYEHQDLPFDQVVEALRPERTLSYSPIFQTMLTLSNAPSGELRLPHLSLEALETPSHTAHFDLELALYDMGDTLEGTFTYATDLFGRETMTRHVGHFLEMLQGMTENDNARVSALPLMTAAQRTDLLAKSMGPRMDLDSATTVHAMFEASAERAPDAIAVIFGKDSLCYGDLERRANRLAHRLIALGVRPDDRVAICFERGFDLVVSILGVLKAGACYVPMDPSYPSERLSFMLADCMPAALLTCTAIRLQAPAIDTYAGPRVLLDADDTLVMLPEHRPTVAELHGGCLAYMIYTSGSTGQPKGVMIEHRGVVNYLRYAHDSYLHDGVEGSVVTTPVGFDATVTSLMVPWLSAKPVVLLPEDPREALSQLLVRFEQASPWLFKLTPAHLDALASLSNTAVSATAHRLVVGGEQLTSRTLLRLRDHVLPNALVVNEYGPTETVVGCTTYFSTVDGESLVAHAVPIGRPTANMRIYLLDSVGEPVPDGVTGEIYIAGEQMARGYYNRPELTGQRFLRDPFASESDARMYRTGDLARRMLNGEIEYLGRNDFQVKIRGFRIELGEIEAKLVTCPGVREAVMLAREDVSGDKRLVAYVVMEEGCELDAVVLREILARSLSDYMLPSAFVILSELPLTANGKVDRKALPSPDAAHRMTSEYELPVGDVEVMLAELWECLLNVERVGRNDHFFTLGGHSLLAISLIERLRQRGYSADPGTIFTAPILSAMAERLTPIDQAAPAPAVPANLIPDAFAQASEALEIEEFKL
jgi:amino acid adenylation domain-containing protein